MSYRFGSAPHQGERAYQNEAPNAALLIDFDNVTMAIRSDLGKELKTLLNSDLIRGKVAVQRAYADWRRYPQYIVPLSEGSVDLIFAPAYGSSKKNATDLRMAIDGMELVFTRPEIGTYILLTGDSDFSSLVLKLKEYGKYVIGVGMKESSSDILVQNCDEYYSYHTLSGLTRTTKDGPVTTAEDPWELVEQALERMVANNDVMRSDRLKQVMLDLDSSFDEKKLGYKKFSKFVQDAAERGLVRVRKLDSGQHELVVGSRKGGSTAPAPKPEDRGNGKREERGRRPSRSRGRSERKPESEVEPESQDAPAMPEPIADAPAEKAAAAPEATPANDDLKSAFVLLQKSLDELGATAGNWAGAADVKRQMLVSAPDFSEGNLGFSKFTRFLQKAHDVEVIELEAMGGGSFRVVKGSTPAEKVKGVVAPLKRTDRPAAQKAEKAEAQPPKTKPPAQETKADEAASAASSRQEKPKAPEPTPTPVGTDKVAARAARRTRGRRGAPTGPPPELLPGQIVGEISVPSKQAQAEEQKADEQKADEKKPAARKTATKKAESKKPAEKKPAAKKSAPKKKPSAKAGKKGDALDLEALGLPRDRAATGAYLTNAYKGVGKKTAESLVEAFGADTFQVMESEPARLEEVLTKGRAKALLEQWVEDRDRRMDGGTPTDAPAKEPQKSAAKKGSGRSRRGGSGAKKSGSAKK